MPFLRSADTLSGGATLSFCLPPQLGPLLKETICSSKSKFFPIRVDTILKGFNTRGSKEEVTELKLSPSKTVEEKIGVYQNTIKQDVHSAFCMHRMSSDMHN